MAFRAHLHHGGMSRRDGACLRPLDYRSADYAFWQLSEPLEHASTTRRIDDATATLHPKQDCR